MSRKLLTVVGICCLAAFPSLLDSAEMKTTPELPVWVADGVTEYRLFVWVDNTAGGPGL